LGIILFQQLAFVGKSDKIKNNIFESQQEFKKFNFIKISVGGYHNLFLLKG
jgi:hypothetical protein